METAGPPAPFWSAVAITSHPDGLCRQRKQRSVAPRGQGGVAANRDWGSFLLDDGSGPERNWLVEHLDGHDVLTVRKCKWVSERTASEQGEIYGTVADFWKRSAHGRSGDFCEAVDAGGAEALLASCRAAQKPQAPGLR